ncbi:MAG: universal stress protein [Bacteroidales bacterium]|nr:universal stress protein [Bacteroidales bacterium]
MSTKRILVPVELTQASDKVAAYAGIIAKKANLELSLLHISRGKSDMDAIEQLKSMAQKLESESSVKCDYLVKEGNLFNEMANVANDPMYSMMIIGSHGSKGIREKLLGSDILKLVKNIPVPVLTIQETGYNFPEKGIQKIVFPASAHTTFDKVIDATVFFAKLFESEVYVYTVEKPGSPWSDVLRSNIEKAISAFERNSINFTRVNEQQSSYSPGYAKQILQYAGKIKADMISVISTPTSEHYYIADSDKERLLTNELQIPVLCVSDKKQV